MITFLKMVAAFIVALIVLVIGVVVFVRWKVKGLLKNLMDAATAIGTGAVPPFRISLKPMEGDDEDDAVWVHDDEVKQLTREFEAAGFTAIGDYDTDGLPLQVRGFQHQDHQAYGVIYDHAMAGTWCDVVRRYSDETTWTVSSGKYHGMDSAPWHTACFLSGQPVSELLKKLLESSPSTGYQNAGADLFVDRFETAYKKEMHWRIERGGATEQEIRRVAEISGQECSEEQVELIQLQWKSAIGSYLSERVLAVWRKETGMPSREYHRIAEQLVVIHNRLTPDQIFELGWDPDQDEDEDSSDELRNKVKAWCSDESPMKAFQKLLIHQSVDTTWKLLGEVQKPVKAQIWERPDESGEDFPEQDEDDE
jgi:hypothetical protein